MLYFYFAVFLWKIWIILARACSRKSEQSSNEFSKGVKLLRKWQNLRWTVKVLRLTAMSILPLSRVLSFAELNSHCISITQQGRCILQGDKQSPYHSVFVFVRVYVNRHTESIVWFPWEVSTDGHPNTRPQSTTRGTLVMIGQCFCCVDVRKISVMTQAIDKLMTSLWQAETAQNALRAALVFADLAAGERIADFNWPCYLETVRNLRTASKIVWYCSQSVLRNLASS